MKTLQKIAVFVLISTFSFISAGWAQMSHATKDHIMINPDQIRWADGPPSLPPGSQFAVIEGNPKEEGLFTMRIKLPANYKIKPHTHPADEHITVLQGTFFMGMSDKYDESIAGKIPAGGFAVMHIGTKHFAFTQEECVIQLHGMGPWAINYLNPDDDPRIKK